jgi:hypothetical protein
MNIELLQNLKEHWGQLRGMTYDFLSEIAEEDLKKTLPFPASQTLGYQFLCMLGTQESNTSYIEKGSWQGFSCSIETEENLTKQTIKESLEKADQSLLQILEEVDLFQKFEDETTSLLNYMILVEHEAHHQGQMINFIYAHNLPIPKSWEEKWALSRED